MTPALPGATATGVDRVTRLDPGELAEGLRYVPATLDVFATHFPRFPVLPGVLTFGSLAELAARLLSADGSGPWRCTGASRVRYRHYVRPGDLVELSVRRTGGDAGRAELRGTARVAGRDVVTVARLEMSTGAGPA